MVSNKSTEPIARSQPANSETGWWWKDSVSFVAMQTPDRNPDDEDDEDDDDPCTKQIHNGS